MKKKGIIDLWLPIKKDQEKLDAVLKDYAVWADLHGGDKASVVRLQDNTDLYVGDSSLLQIKNEIKRNRENSPVDQEPDHLLNARIFLCFAQELDNSNNGINRDICIIDEMERKLMSDLRGEMGINQQKDTATAATGPNDPGIHMPAERLNAWTRLFLYQAQRQKDKPSGLFITGSRAIFELLTDSCVNAETIVNMPLMSISGPLDDKMLTWQNNLLEKLNKIVTSSWPVVVGELNIPYKRGGSGRPFSLKICVVPDQNPVDFFSQYCNSYSRPSEAENLQTRYGNTLIGLIEVSNLNARSN